MERISFNDYFMKIAHQVKLRSPDLTKVGAIIVSLKNNTITSTGYNGTPRGCNDNIDWNNRELVHSLVIHAEMNAILYAQSRFEDSVMYITLSPCSQCIKLIAAANIKKIYYNTEYKDISKVKTLCEYFNIELIKM
jgi:dCMP deaminase